MTKTTPKEMQERIDELGEHIKEARHQAEEHGTLPNPHHRATFAHPDGDDGTDQSVPATKLG